MGGVRNNEVIVNMVLGQLLEFFFAMCKTSIQDQKGSCITGEVKKSSPCFHSRDQNLININRKQLLIDVGRRSCEQGSCTSDLFKESGWWDLMCLELL